MKTNSQKHEIEPLNSARPSTHWPARIVGSSSLCLGLAAAILSGCADARQHLVLDTVGPVPTSAASTKAATGSLVVYSACESIPNFDPLSDCWASDSGGTLSGIGYTWDYTRYKILTTEGKKLRSVKNNVGTIPHPEQVELPSGNYYVEASSTGYGRIKVPVVIGGNQITVLHLDGDGFWPREYGLSETNSVRLPNGNIIGWRSTAEIASTP